MSKLFLGKEYDQPEVRAGTTTRTYLVLGSPRTGSTLLCSMLFDIAKYGLPYEYFNPAIHMAGRFGITDTPRDIASIDVDAYLKALIANRSTVYEDVRTGVTTAAWGVKLFPAHFSWMVGSSKGDSLVSSSKILRIRRRDRIAQAVSMHIASSTGDWNSHNAKLKRQKKGEVATASYNFGAIARRLHTLTVQDNFWDIVIKRYGIEKSVYTIFYEDLVSDTQRVGREIIEHLRGYYNNEIFDTRSPVVKTEKQADDQNMEFTHRFIHQCDPTSKRVRRKILNTK